MTSGDDAGRNEGRGTGHVDEGGAGERRGYSAVGR